MYPASLGKAGANSKPALAPGVGYALLTRAVETWIPIGDLAPTQIPPL